MQTCPEINNTNTPKLLQVRAYLLQGLSDKEIARKMSCSEGSVKMHVRQIFLKENVPTRAKLLAKYLNLSQEGK